MNPSTDKREHTADIDIAQATLKIVSKDDRFESLNAYEIKLSSTTYYTNNLNPDIYYEYHRDPFTGGLNIDSIDDKLVKALIDRSPKTFVLQDPNSERIITFENVYVNSLYVSELGYTRVGIEVYYVYESNKEEK